MHDMTGVSLQRPAPPKTIISLVPMVDVMLILLVFFMVTSTYLNLDMIPAIQRNDEPESTQATAETEQSATLLVRIRSDGLPTVGGQTFAQEDLEALLRARVAENALLRVLVLPSGAASMQSLVTVMDAATKANVADVRVIRLQASP